MIIVDTALEKREAEGSPIRVAIVGAGYMGRGLALQIISSVRGMRLVAVSNRTLAKAERAFRQAGIDDPRSVETARQLEDSISQEKPAIADNGLLLCEAEGVDVVVEATGDVEFGAQIALAAIRHGKHIVLLNAEVDALVGPILKVHADKAGVIISNVDGDQPGVIMNLLRFVRMIGSKPVLAGNIKGILDNYRTPETQRAFADKHNQDTKMITSFADGTKLAMEMTVVANATGFRVVKRGMQGPACKHVTEALKLFPLDQLLNGGVVDFVVGAEPGPGVFVLGYNDNPIQQQYANCLKMGDGPLYVYYVPYHLPHLETPITIARAVLFRDATVAPIGPPVVEVITAAKTDLKSDTTLDGIGGFHGYGLAENADICRTNSYLPMSLSEGCRLKRAIPKDDIITYDDVELPQDRVSVSLRAEQDAFFGI